MCTWAETYYNVAINAGCMMPNIQKSGCVVSNLIVMELGQFFRKSPEPNGGFAANTVRLAER